MATLTPEQKAKILEAVSKGFRSTGSVARYARASEFITARFLASEGLNPRGLHIKESLTICDLRVKEKKTQRELAAQFGVTQAAIHFRLATWMKKYNDLRSRYGDNFMDSYVPPPLHYGRDKV